MVSRRHVLFLVLLPVLAQVAADDTDEQMMSEMIRGDQNSVPSAPMRPSPNTLFLPDSPLALHSALLLRLLQTSDGSPREEAAPASAATARESPSESSPLLASRPEYSLPSPAVSEYEDSGVNKRVFCNGFTGCGGRHRDRSRRQERYGKRLIPLLVKRPFCNSFGCYNGKRSLPASARPALATLADAAAPNFRARAVARMLAAAASARRRQQLQEGEEAGLARRVVLGGGAEAGSGGPLGKRLFCNGYGGCRGGKRSLFSPWMSKMSGVVTAETRR